MSGHRRLSAGQWRELLAEHRRSGLGVEAFCRQHGVGMSTFFSWQQRLGKRPAKAPTFVEVTEDVQRASDGSGWTSGSPIEVVLPSGITLRIVAGFNAEMLRQVVEALS